MTTYVGKDVDIFLGSNQVLYAQELSFEIDNGQLDVREISSDTVKEFVWTKIAVSGSLKIRSYSFRCFLGTNFLFYRYRGTCGV